MLFNKIKIGFTFIFVLIFFCSLAYNKHQYDTIKSYEAEVSTLRTTLENVKTINDKNNILDNRYNNLLNTINRGNSYDTNNIIKDFNSISNSLSSLYDNRVQ